MCRNDSNERYTIALQETVTLLREIKENLSK